MMTKEKFDFANFLNKFAQGQREKWQKEKEAEMKEALETFATLLLFMHEKGYMLHMIKWHVEGKESDEIKLFFLKNEGNTYSIKQLDIERKRLGIVDTSPWKNFVLIDLIEVLGPYVEQLEEEVILKDQSKRNIFAISITWLQMKLKKLIRLIRSAGSDRAALRVGAVWGALTTFTFWFSSLISGVVMGLIFPSQPQSSSSATLLYLLLASLFNGILHFLFFWQVFKD